MPMFETILLASFVGALSYAAFTDLIRMIIPNRLCALLAVAGMSALLLTGASLSVFAFHLTAGAVVFLVSFMLFATGVMGGGDVKLLAATSLWFGLDASLGQFLVHVALFGGVLTLVVLIARTRFGSPVFTALPMTHNLTDAQKGVPYGIAIAVAGIVCVADAPLAQALLAS